MTITEWNAFVSANRGMSVDQLYDAAAARDGHTTTWASLTVREQSCVLDLLANAPTSQATH